MARQRPPRTPEVTANQHPRRSILTGTVACVALAALAVALHQPAPTVTPPETDDRSAKAHRDRTVVQQAPAAAEVVMPSDPPEPGLEQSWATDIVRVRPADGDLYALARRTGSTVFRPLGRSGMGALQVPDGHDATTFLAELVASGEATAGGPMGLVQGAGETALQKALREEQWGNEKSELESNIDDGIGLVVVAVLDTGVAYLDYTEADGTPHRAAPGLANSDIVAPWDFVNDDPYPGDDHQHGTHIASIIAGQGDLSGVAPGVGLMPVKVLDEDNLGNEHDLIEGIYHATDNGADIINLSLAFAADYVPSRALLDAIAYAADQGVLMVAAAGNGAMAEVAWPAASPAASPAVIAVGAYCPADKPDFTLAPYSNRGPAVDTVGPGGCMDRDLLGKRGYPDGIIGETIALNDPETVGYWMMAGTSQAAAHISGAAATGLADGKGSLDGFDLILHATASDRDRFGFAMGAGAGRLKSKEVTKKVSEGLSDGDLLKGTYYISLMPFLRQNEDRTVTPVAKVTVLKSDGKRAKDLMVYGDLTGTTSGPVACELDTFDKGACLLEGESVEVMGADGVPESLAWRFNVTAVVHDDRRAYRPTPAFFATDDLERFTDELSATPELDDAGLAFHWQASWDDDLGPVAESYVVVDSGAGITTSPFGLLVSPTALAPLVVEHSASIDGSGISTSPFGYQVLDVPGWTGIDGSGISTSPFGFRLVVLDAQDALGGSGISTSPFGLKSMAGPKDGILYRDDEYFQGDPILMGSSRIQMLDSNKCGSGSSIDDKLKQGGWTKRGSAQLASTLATDPSFGLGTQAVGMSSGRGVVAFTAEE